MFTLILLNIILVTLLKIFRQDNVSVFSDCMHTSFLADCVDVSSRYSVRSGHIVFKINLVAQVHLCCDCGEDETLLSSIRKRELNLPVQSSRSKQSRIKRSYVVFVDKFGPLAINFSSDFWASAFCWLLFWDTLYQLVLGISSCSMKAATEQELRYS